MATCGEYELQRAVGWGRRGTFFLAQGGGKDALVVIRRARSAERGFSQAFLRSAAEQQAAAEGGCSRIAPIRAFHVDASGFAWYATMRFEASLADFIDAGCKVDSDFLRDIASGVLAALTELNDKSRRAHGNITPGNVLLDSDGGIFLTDLAPSGKDATTADDLFALGTLIYQLVRRIAHVGALNPPVDYSPEWTDSLGDDAEKWREFTNRLLTKSRYRGTDALKAAAADLKSLRQLETRAPAQQRMPLQSPQSVMVRRPPPKKRHGAKIAALAAVLALAGGGFWFLREKQRKERSAEAERIANEERRKFEDALGAKLKAFREALKGAPPPEIVGDQDLQYRFKRIAATLEAPAGGTQLSPEAMESDVQLKLNDWPVLAKLKTRALEWRTPPREWPRFADELDAAARISVAVAEENDRPILEQITGAARKLAEAGTVEDRWNDILSTLAALKQTQNPLLPDFTEWAAGELRNALRLDDMPDRAKSVMEKLRAVQDFHAKDWSRVVQERFKSDATGVFTEPSPERLGEWPREWVRQAQRFLRPQEEKLAEWRKELARVDSVLAKSNRPAAEAASWKQKADAARDAIGTALESDAARIDGMLREFGALRDPMADAHEQYAAFFTAWKSDALAAADKAAAQAALKKFEDGTKGLPAAYKTKARTDAIAAGLKAALATPDRMTLRFGRNDWQPVASDPTHAIYKLGEVEVPFMPVGGGFAMSAIEMPLRLMKLTGMASQPGDGPQIRTRDFGGVVEWLWSGPMNFVASQGLGTYFAPGVRAGDLGSDLCPATWLTFQEAKTAAENLGGQLPTSAQWAAAANTGGRGRRLRSAAWSTQLRLVESWRARDTGHGKRLPDTGSFSKLPQLAATAYLTDNNAAAGADNDGVLWLRSVLPDGGWKPADKFFHIIGNAAEWVNDGGAPGIIGGSVVSPPSLPLTQKLTPSLQGASFDVTFRLVVPMGEGGEGAGLQKFLDEVKALALPAAPQP